MNYDVWLKKALKSGAIREMLDNWPERATYEKTCLRHLVPFHGTKEKYGVPADAQRA